MAPLGHRTVDSCEYIIILFICKYDYFVENNFNTNHVHAM